MICSPFRREHRDLVEQGTAQIVRVSPDQSRCSPSPSKPDWTTRRRCGSTKRVPRTSTWSSVFGQTCPPLRKPWTQSHSFCADMTLQSAAPLPLSLFMICVWCAWLLWVVLCVECGRQLREHVAKQFHPPDWVQPGAENRSDVVWTTGRRRSQASR